MRTETDPVTGTQAVAAPLGAEKRSDEAPRGEVGQDRPAPDPEVVAKPTRRQFTAEYRLRIVKEADWCTRPGEVGRLLRREGLYTSHLTARPFAARSIARITQPYRASYGVGSGPAGACSRGWCEGERRRRLSTRKARTRRVRLAQAIHARVGLPPFRRYSLAMNENDEERIAAHLAKTMAMMCVQNTELENIHAGLTLVTRTGDYSDVLVVDADGREFPRPEVSHFDDDAMRDLMRQVVNRIYSFQLLRAIQISRNGWPLGVGRSEMGRAGAGCGFSESRRSFLSDLNSRRRRHYGNRSRAYGNYWNQKHKF